mgnify:CR=1 FL=1
MLGFHLIMPRETEPETKGSFLDEEENFFIIF